jgi:hypothetical protein
VFSKAPLSLKDTCSQIIKHESHDPSHLSQKALKFIFKMIQADPSSRPDKLLGETGVFWDTGSRGTVRGKIENIN